MARTNRRRNKRQSRRGSSKNRGFLGGSAIAENSAIDNYSNNGGGGSGWVEGKY